jgi:hypothetical protein
MVLILLAFSCQKEKLTDPNDELVGEWVLVKTFSAGIGFDTSDELKTTKWKIQSDGKLKMYKHGMKQNTESWEHAVKIFYGPFIDSIQTFEMDSLQAISISNNGTWPFWMNGDTLKIYKSYVDGVDLYFKRKK